MPVLFAWRLLEWLRSYDGIKFWSVENAFIHSRQKSINSFTCIRWDVITRDMIKSVCSPLVIHTLKLYSTSWYFSPSITSPSLFIKIIEFFHNLPTLDVHTDDDWETFFSTTWFLHYWNEENLLHPYSLGTYNHDNFYEFLLPRKKAKIWCELFDVLHYLEFSKKRSFLANLQCWWQLYDNN